MSYEEFRRRIDTARNILVGAVPSPAGQIDQITYAMMYKFMNDIDDQAAALGGKRSYFIGDYEQYNWHKLMSSSLGAHERLELYRQAIQTMAKNPNIPELFRSIYQNAFLPFNSPNVLNLFLKEIDKFNHGESDDIGDAYEYLLSITGAQGDVGQFRTPRHIIKFIVEAVNPTKDDTVIDPACGTAGFLISAYNHVRSQHDGKDEQGNENDKEKRLSSSELDKIHHNYRGFDIDPTMVRTAKVNLYLHGFKTPDIINHDSLSSEDYWNEHYDVILANPPFMTPKGGIQPHKKFGISANRAEVLFVDYIASHLKPSGRAGIIVPEGVIFQSGKAYKELRKNLVENSLYAVISLPSGVFNPYAGVKTSILLLDKELAKQNDEVLFVKVENDGYSLGAQRRKVAGDQFPEALEAIERFKNGEELQAEFAHVVKRSAIAESGDYNLSGDRYKAVADVLSDYELVALGDLVAIDNGNAFKSSEYVDDGARVMRITNVQKGEIVDDSPKFMALSRIGEFSKYELHPKDLLMSLTGNVGRVGVIDRDLLPALLNQRVARLRPNETKILKEYLFNILNTDNFETAAIDSSSGIAQKNLSTEWLKTYKIPLPPIEIQREIVAELDGYQKIIDAAQTIAKTYKPTIKINPEWPTYKLEQVVTSEKGAIKAGPFGSSLKKEFYTETGYKIYGQEQVIKQDATYGDYYIDKERYKSLASCAVKSGDVLISLVGTYGKLLIIPKDHEPGIINPRLVKISLDPSKINNYYFKYYFESGLMQSHLANNSYGGTMNILNAKILRNLTVPVPAIDEQELIVDQLNIEQKLIDANKKLIETFQAKIKSKIAEVWGE